MPNWVQLVAYTAEHTPGPFLAREYTTATMNGVLLFRKGEDKRPRAVAMVYEERDDEPGSLFPTADGVSVPTEATARLFIDAPEMLALLARWANNTYKTGPLDKVAFDKFRELLDETENVIRRHVRIGCDPVDAESRPTVGPFDGNLIAIDLPPGPQE